jgi:hypothetical protein
MNAWSRVKWTEAQQVVDLMDLGEPLALPAGADPRSGFEQLREAGDLTGAVSFLGHALPRLEAIAWAAHLLDDFARQDGLPLLDRQTLDHVQRWLGDPSDDHRRSAHAASEAATADGAERLLGLAVFFSGGSMAPPELQPVLPLPELSGRMAANAIIVAAHRVESSDDRLLKALELGEVVADKGLEALAPR